MGADRWAAAGAGSVAVVNPTRRRHPNFMAFIGTGVVIGFIVGSAVAYFVPGNTTQFGRVYSDTTSVMFMGIVGAFLFGLLAAVLAVLLDRRR
jgi:uncharacterized membrane protein YeaQ/YmgE (transglycosylase-associated protein family)